MPSVQAPDGRVLEFPEGTPPEQVIAVLRQHYPEQFASVPEPGAAPAPAPAPPEAAPSGPGGPRAPEPGGGGGPPILAPPEPARAVPEPAPISYDPTEGMTAAQKFGAGVGQSLMSTGRGIQQLWNTVTGDEEDLARLEREEATARKMDEALLSTGWGRTGQIAGHVGQALIPAGGAAKGASLAGKALQLKRTLPAVMAAEGLVGGGMGGLMPTVEGESRAQNVKEGAILGAAIPGLGAAGKKIAQSAPARKLATAAAIIGKSPLPYGLVQLADVIAAPIKKARQTARGVKESAAAKALADALELSKSEARSAVTAIQRGVDVPHTALGRQLREHLDTFGRDVPDAVRNTLRKALGDTEVRRPTTVAPPKPPKPKEPKAPKEEVKRTTKETTGQKLKRQAAENDAKRAREEMIRLAAGAKPRVGDAGRAPGPVNTITSPQKPKIPDPVNRAEKMERKANALRRGTEPPKPTGNTEADKRAMERWAAGRDPSKPFSGLSNQRSDPLLTQRAVRKQAHKPIDVPPQATPEYKRTQLPIDRANKKRLQGVYQEARASSAQKPRLPADKPKGPPAPPRVMHGPKEGPTIKGSDLHEVLSLLEAQGGTGLKAESAKRLRNIIESAQGKAMTEAQNKSLVAARKRALEGHIPAKPFQVKPSPKRQTVRALIEQFRSHEEDED